VVRRFYEELCNRWRFELAEQLLSSDVRFRAALGTTVRGRDAFVQYLRSVRAVFPDLYHRIDDMLTDDNRVAVRLTYSGTHSGTVGEVQAQERMSSSSARACSRTAGRISDGWVVGDTQEVWRALGRL